DLDLSRIELRRRGDHLIDGLVEVGSWLSLKAQRVDSRDDECLEIRALEPTFLEPRHRGINRLAQLHQLVRALAPSLDRFRKLRGEELVAALEHRVERATGETTILLIAESKCDERGFLKLRPELPFRTI